jgi:NAD-dependent SIR2 family protein deacetylase
MSDKVAKQHDAKTFMIEHHTFYLQNPRDVWGMKARVMNIFLTKKLHLGYYKLKELLENKKSFIVTSNINDHYREADFNENRLYEIHGRLKILQCINRKCNQKHNLWKLKELPQEKNMTLIGKKDNESSHIHQDKVYRAFIRDISKGELCSLKDIISVAKMIKKDVVKYDGQNKRWYA